MSDTARYVAFLRAINVGGRRVKMPRLKALLEELDVTDVDTYLASGNVVFTASSGERATLEAAISAHLEATLGFAVESFVRTLDEVAELARAENDPFGEAANAPSVKRYVSFVHEPLDAAQRAALEAVDDDVYDLLGRGAEVHWLRDLDGGDSRFANTDVEGLVGVPATRRNLNTLRRIARTFGDSG